MSWWQCFGRGLDPIKHDRQTGRGRAEVEDTLQDFRVALRALAKDRRFTLVAVTTLALGIGANAAMFSVVESVLLRPLPYRNPERLVWIAETDSSATSSFPMVVGADLEMWQSQATSFDALTVLLTGDTTLNGDEPQPVRVGCVSAPVGSVFGVMPALGRDFLPQEFHHAPQAPGLRPSAENLGGTATAIVSDRLFRRLGRPDILGTSIEIGGTPYTVIGVLPASFRLPVSPSLQLGVGAQTDVDVLLNTTIGVTSRSPGAVLGRLKPGVEIATALAELDGLRENANRVRPPDQGSSGFNLSVVSLHDHVVSNTRNIFLILWASVTLVLIVACVNTSSLLLARSVARQQETALRTALGAGRWRLIRLALAENMLLSVAGGFAGLALGYVVVRLVTRFAIDVPRLQDATLNPLVLLFTVAICAISGIALSVIPALRSDLTIGAELKQDAGTSSGARRVRQWHSALVVSEVGLALVLLVGAALMLRSLQQVRSEGAALAPLQVITARIQAHGGPQAAVTPARRLQRSDELLERMESLPGVRAAALWSVTFGYPTRIAGLPPLEREINAMWLNVSPHYKGASGVQLLAGRWFASQDRTANPPSVVVSERLVRRFAADFPDLTSIVGRTIFGPFAPSGSTDRDVPMTIIGVVSDFRSGRIGIMQPDDPDPFPQVFFPDVLRPMAAGELLVRTKSDPGALVGAIRTLVDNSGGIRLASPRTLDAQLRAAVQPRRFHTILIVAFAALAGVLALIGVAGVISYSVTQRSSEIGLRIALGAQRGDILRLVLSYAAWLVALGVTVGVIGAVLLSRAVQSVLYGVAPTDLASFITVPILMVVIALLAAYLPARRAMHLDPMVALRQL